MVSPAFVEPGLLVSMSCCFQKSLAPILYASNLSCGTFHVFFTSHLVIYSSNCSILRTKRPAFHSPGFSQRWPWGFNGLHFLFSSAIIPLAATNQPFTALGVFKILLFIVCFLWWPKIPLNMFLRLAQRQNRWGTHCSHNWMASWTRSCRIRP